MTARQLVACRCLPGLALFLMALLAGCASAPSSPSLFVLDSGTNTADHSQKSGEPTLMIAPVTTAEYLNQGGIVYQSAPHRVTIANDNRWASPLSDQLDHALYLILNQHLPNVDVTRAGGDQEGDYQLHTYVDQFLGHYDGKAHIAGHWELSGPDDKTLTKHAFTRTVPLKSDGYPALVDSLSKGWQGVGRAMASRLEGALRSKRGP